MISTGPQGLVVPRNERICMYNVTLLLELKLLVKYRSHLGRRDISGVLGYSGLGSEEIMRRKRKMEREEAAME